MPSWSVADLLPGLWVLALGALLAATLRRWYDPLPRAVLAAFAAVLALLFGAVLVGGRTLLPVDALRAAPPFDRLAPAPTPSDPLTADLATVVAPARAAVRRTLRAGEWPLWNPDAGAGVPLLATPEAQAAAPPLLAVLPLPLARAAGAAAALQTLLALVFTFLFLRREGAGAAPAFAGALAYGLGGYLQLGLGRPQATAAAFFPALLYASALSVERGARRDLALLTAAAFGVLTAGDRDIAGTALLAALAFLLVRLARSRPPSERGRPLRAQLLAGALAVAFAAPLLLPAAAYAPSTAASEAARKGSRLIDDPFGLAGLADPGQSGAALAAARDRLVAAVAPGAPGIDRRGADAAAFTGTAVLLLALLTLLPAVARSSPRLGGERLCVVLAGLGLAAVAWPPAVAPLVDHLPLLHLRPPGVHRLALPLAFALAYLATAALTRLEARGGAAGSRRTAAAAIGGVALLLALALVAAHRVHPGLAVGGGKRLVVQLAVVALAAGALIAGALRGGGTRRLATLAVAAAIAGELLAFHARASPPVPRRLAYPPAAPLAHLADALAKHPGARFAGFRAVLSPDLATVYDLPDARIVGASRPYAYDLLTARLAPGRGDANGLFAHPLDPLYDLLGVRYVLTAPGVELGPPLALRFADSTGRVYERPAPLPRLVLPRTADVYRGGGWPERVAAIHDFAAAALVEESFGHGGPWAAAAGAAEVSVTGVAATHLTARASLAGERLLVASIYQDGGWRVQVDGAAVPTLFADGPLLAAWLPAGEHRIDLLYRPAAFVAGMLLAAAALAAAAAWLAAPGRGADAGRGW